MLSYLQGISDSIRFNSTHLSVLNLFGFFFGLTALIKQTALLPSGWGQSHRHCRPYMRGMQICCYLPLLPTPLPLVALLLWRPTHKTRWIRIKCNNNFAKRVFSGVFRSKAAVNGNSCFRSKYSPLTPTYTRPEGNLLFIWILAADFCAVCHRTDHKMQKIMKSAAAVDVAATAAATSLANTHTYEHIYILEPHNNNNNSNNNAGRCLTYWVRARVKSSKIYFVV